jgi:hypothetical protein
MRVRAATRAAAFAIAVAAFAGSMTGIAWAPKNLFGSGIATTCEVKDGGTGQFQGSLTITGFTVTKGQLVGVGTMSGTCTPDIGSTFKEEQLPLGTALLVPFSIDALTCDTLDLILGDISVSSVGMTVHTAGRHLVVAPATKAERARFCAAAKVVGARSAVEAITPLNHLIFQ